MGKSCRGTGKGDENAIDESYRKSQDELRSEFVKGREDR
jgi:hypothetical protein